MTRIADEVLLNALLRDHGVQTDAFHARMNSTQRKDAFRGAIQFAVLAETEATQQRGSPLSFGQLFEQLFGEPL